MSPARRQEVQGALSATFYQQVMLKTNMRPCSLHPVTCTATMDECRGLTPLPRTACPSCLENWDTEMTR